MIRIEQLGLRVGSFALREVSLEVRPGEYFVLLGPSGSGKTLLLECLCGLHRVDAGRIRLAGADVTRLEPRHRGIGYVPQDYALFPHMSVRNNVRFALRRRDLSGPMEAPTADQLLQWSGLAHLAGRLPDKLSGGEKQRVALARALAMRPRVLLLDEPVSALDEPTRDTLCRYLKQLQRKTGTTTLHVCHNLAEMLAVADRVGVIHQGRILQVGTPQELLGKPRSLEIARFVHAGNLFSARAEPDGPWLRLIGPGGMELRAVRPPGAVAGEVSFMVRPENVRVCRPGGRGPRCAPETALLEGTVEQAVDSGPLVQLTVRCGPLAAEWLVSMGKKEHCGDWMRVGERVQLAVDARDVHMLEGQ